MSYKVGFYLENKDIPNADLRTPELGNPGIGGTEFLFSTICYYLNKYKGARRDTFLLFANTTAKLSSDIDVLTTDDIYNFVIQAEQLVDIVVFRPRRKLDSSLIELLKTSRLKIVLWLHVTPEFSYLRELIKLENVKAVVCVEAEQHDVLFDMPNAEKLTYIVNGFDIDGFISDIPNNDVLKRNREVVYLGALVPVKGFHRLAKIWPKILKKVPDAKLVVIGSSTVYSEESKMGSLGISSRDYEDQYIKPFLTDKSGKLLDSVKFLGKKGMEKKNIIRNAAVAVPNPTAQGENCPGVCLEIQALKTPLVTAARFGMIDTVKTGCSAKLVKTDDEMVREIVQCLARQNYVLCKCGFDHVKTRYGYEEVTNSWFQLFESIINNQKIPNQPFKNNIFHEAKFLYLINCQIRKLFMNCRWLPMVGEWKIYLKRLFFRT